MRSIGYDSETLPPPKLLDGVETAVCEILGIRRLKHRSALLELSQLDLIAGGVVTAIFEQIARNWLACRALRPDGGSPQNWRWRKPQLSIAGHNTSPEVMLERALAIACELQGRTDWANQVPVASGIWGPYGGGARAIDLVSQTGPKAFQLVELKVASDTPLYAAVEIIAYTSLWLLTRAESRTADNALLNADQIEAVVLAPESYYTRYRIEPLQRRLDEEMAILAQAHGVKLGFAFEAVDDALVRPPFEDKRLMHLLDHRRRL